MIDVNVVSRGELSITPIISRPTTNYKIEHAITISCSILSSLSNKEYVKYNCKEFPGLITPNWNRDVSYFSTIAASSVSNNFAIIKKEIGFSEDDVLENYSIVINRSFFETLNVSIYETAIRKFLKSITGI